MNPKDVRHLATNRKIGRREVLLYLAPVIFNVIFAIIVAVLVAKIQVAVCSFIYLGFHVHICKGIVEEYFQALDIN